MAEPIFGGFGEAYDNVISVLAIVGKDENGAAGRIGGRPDPAVGEMPAIERQAGGEMRSDTGATPRARRASHRRLGSKGQ